MEKPSSVDVTSFTSAWTISTPNFLAWASIFWARRSDVRITPLFMRDGAPGYTLPPGPVGDESGVGISGACRLYPVDELPASVSNGKATVSTAAINSWTPQPLDRKTGS